MALIQCPECRAEISDKANQCPRCGVPIKRKTTTKNLLLIATGLIIFSIICALYEPSSNSSKTLQTRVDNNQATALNVPFEELGLQPGRNGVWMNIFIYTPVKDRSLLLKIADVYIKRYSDIPVGFYIFFFNNRKKAAHNLDQLANDGAQACLTGKFVKNKTNGIEKLE